MYIPRREYSDIIEKRIRDLKLGYRQNIAILGDELCGKTTLIHHILNELCDNYIVPVYLEARPDNLDSFCRRFIGVMLYNFLSNSAIPLKEDLSFLINKSSKYIPKTSEKIKGILNALAKRKKINIFTELLSLCESLNQESGKFCVVIFDEFHNLETLQVKNLYGEWSKLLITQKNTMFIIISSAKAKAKNILTKNLALLFGNFETLTIEPFDIPLSETYLKHKLSGLALTPGLKSFLVHFTGGCPFYLKVISESLTASSGANLTQIIENLLFEASGILSQRFSNYMKRFLDSPRSQDYLEILNAIACGQNKQKELAVKLHKTKSEIEARLDFLIETDVISRNADFLKINDRVFGFWLKFVFQEKSHSLTFNAKNQKDFFRKNIETMIQDYLISSQRPLIERIQEILHMFENETLQLERKKIRLNRFREIKAIEFNRASIKHGLIGRSGDCVWIIAIKNEPLAETDISEFARECKKYQHKTQRKVIISLCDIDTNAHLRAMEEKIIMWDLNNLNQIFDYFSKPRLIMNTRQNYAFAAQTLK